jgi:hypothetical protein
MEAFAQAGSHGRRACPQVSRGLDVGGFEDRPDWPKMGPSLLIATCLVLAIRTAKRPAIFDASFSDIDLDAEIRYSIHLAERVLATLLSSNEAIFPRRKEPWYQPNGEDQPK